MRRLLTILMLVLAAAAAGAATDRFAGVEAVPVSHYAERQTAGTANRLTLYAYPKYYRDAGNRWTATRERFRRDGKRYLADEGVHSLAVAADGTIVGSHKGKAITLRLRALTTLDRDGKEAVAQAVDLSAWVLDDSEIEKGKLTWRDAVSGSAYSVWWFADGFRDAFTLGAASKAAVAAKAPARFGLAFDCVLPDLPIEIGGKPVAAIDTEDTISLRDGTATTRLRPAFLPNPADATGQSGWRERWALKAGRLTQTVPAAALDAVEALRTTVTYDEGDHLTADTALGASTYHYGTDTTMYIGNYSSVQHGMFLFDLSDLTGVTAVSSATLSLYQISHNADALPMSTARILAGTWSQTTSGWNQTGYPCWDYYVTATVAWNTAGCQGVGSDRTALSVNTTTVPVTAAVWVNFDVQEWCDDWLVDGDPNYGFLVMATDATDGRGKFGTLDTVDTSQRPKLTIVYEAAGGGWRFMHFNRMRRQN